MAAIGTLLALRATSDIAAQKNSYDGPVQECPTEGMNIWQLGYGASGSLLDGTWH